MPSISFGGNHSTGEHIYAAAAREVFEETGVRASMDCILTQRHYHGYRWGCSDLYMVCAGRAEQGDGSAAQVGQHFWCHFKNVQNPTTPCPEEAAAADWFSMDEIDRFDKNVFHEFHRFVIEQWRQVQQKQVALRAIEFETHVAGSRREYKIYKIDISSPTCDVNRDESKL
jgi:8-oxo-dGTP pyrophosphatase MutT (NUDIX family)